MPSSLHEAFVAFFCTHIHCALQLANQLGLDLQAPLPLWQVTVGDFGDPGRRGKDYQADAVLVAFPPDTPAPAPVNARAIATLILEPQLSFEVEKGISWLVYRAGVASRHGDGGQWVLVISPKPSVLDRFRAVFPLNPELRPILVGPGSVTAVLDADIADANPAWAALCAALHARGPSGKNAAVVAFKACTDLPADSRRCTFELVSAGLPKDVMDQVKEEVPPATKLLLSEYEREGAWYLNGVEAGRVEGEAKGLDAGRVEGEAKGLRSSLLALLASRALPIDPDQRARIETCADPDQLQRWFERALRATSVAEILTSDD